MAKIRYQKILRGGQVELVGPTLAAVCGMGEGLIIDWKARRIAYHGMYPPSVTTWRTEGQFTDTWEQLLVEASRYCHGH